MPYCRSIVSPMRDGIEEAERALEDRADFLAGLQRVDRQLLHQELQSLGERRLAAAHRAEEIEDLLALLQALRRVAEISDDALDRLFHAVEIGEGWIDPDGAIHEDAAEPLVVARIDDLRLADRRKHALGGAAHRPSARGRSI